MFGHIGYWLIALAAGVLLFFWAGMAFSLYVKRPRDADFDWGMATSFQFLLISLILGAGLIGISRGLGGGIWAGVTLGAGIVILAPLALECVGPLFLDLFKRRRDKRNR